MLRTSLIPQCYRFSLELRTALGGIDPPLFLNPTSPSIIFTSFLIRLYQLLIFLHSLQMFLQSKQLFLHYCNNIEKMSYSYLLKYIIIGDQSVGKSCILMRFIDNEFKMSSDPTIGVEFGSKTIKVHNKVVKLQIWDTAGQEAYKSITRSYYRGTIGVVLVYDISSLTSFQNAAKWLEEAKNFATNENIEVVLVGNKSDKNNERQVSFDKAVDFAKRNQVSFIESSAKTGFNTTYAFELLTQKIVEKIELGAIDLSDDNGGVKLGQYEPTTLQIRGKASCC